MRLQGKNSIKRAREKENTGDETERISGNGRHGKCTEVMHRLGIIPADSGKSYFSMIYRRLPKCYIKNIGSNDKGTLIS